MLDDEEPVPALFSLWDDGLTVVATDTSTRRKKETLDRLTVQHLVEELRMSRRQVRQGVIVVAGADQLGLGTVRAIADQTFASGVRLVLLMNHLGQEQEQHLLGTSGSAAIMMRLGNAKEAARAAEFVGRGNRFMISQVTRQIGRTFTEGVSERLSGAADESMSTTRAQTWQSTASRAVAGSEIVGIVESRTYEVEPTELQALPTTAYILVEVRRGLGGAR